MLVRNIERYKWSPVRNQQEPLQYLDSSDIKKGEREIYKGMTVLCTRWEQLE